jgi:hypothetical protein
MSRAAASALLAALAVLAPACSRPPKGMRRLDSGDSNHWFHVDQRRRHLFYLQGGGDWVTKLGVVNLETGRRGSYRFSPENIVAIHPSFHEDAVTVAVEASGGSHAENYDLLKVDADSGRVLLREPRATISAESVAAFGESSPLDPSEGAPAGVLTPSVSSTTEDNGSVRVRVEPVGGVAPGIKATTLRGGRRTTAFFPTPTAPENTIIGPDGQIYTSSLAPDGKWRVEELQPLNGVRRTLAVFSGKVESMAYAGQGLALLRRGDDGSGPRQLALIDAAAGRVALELPWSDGESEILDADTDQRLLYIRMNEGEAQTCWAVHFDEPALRAASAYLAAARAPGVRKMTDTDVLALSMTGGMVVLLVLILAALQG